MALSLLFILLVSYLGIIAGYFLGKIAPEERKPLRGTVIILQHISAFLAFVSAWIGAYFIGSISLMVTLLALVLMIIYTHTIAKGVLREYRLSLTSIVLGMFILFSSPQVLLFTASCAFIFFACLGIVKTTSKLNSLWNLAKETCWFLAVALLALL